METEMIYGVCLGCEAKIPHDEWEEFGGLCEECDTPLMREFLQNEETYLNDNEDW